MSSPDRDAILRAVEEARDEMVEFTRALVRIPTENPPGDAYEPCARLIGETLQRCAFEVEYITATDRPEHSERYPRTNVLGRRAGDGDGPCVHLNGHVDVVPAGNGWTVPPYEGVVREGRVYGRGSADMKGGLAAAVFAAEGLRRAGVSLRGSINISGTVDEESGGFAGVAHLAAIGRLTSRTVDYVIIPEPLGVERICIGHRGVWWFEVTTHGHVAHGSMPFLGVSAIDAMGEVLHDVRCVLQPLLAARRTAMPVVPQEARQATLNVNAVSGGQAGFAVQSPCVADRCHATFDRRFLAEESLDAVRAEVGDMLDAALRRVPGARHEVRDLLVVQPVRTPAASPLVAALSTSIAQVRGREASLVASPGTYDHKHVTRIGGIEQCVAYGPGILELSHQPDEWVGIDDMVHAAQVIALTVADLLNGTARYR